MQLRYRYAFQGTSQDINVQINLNESPNALRNLLEQTLGSEGLQVKSTRHGEQREEAGF